MFFSKKVTNFQFPTINNHYSTSFKNSSNIVLLENQEAFIKQVELKNSQTLLACWLIKYQKQQFY